MPLDILKIVKHIIKEQQTVIGPLAWEEAGKVTGLRVDAVKQEVHVEGDPKAVLESLVAQYEPLFGLASREVCRDAVRNLISQASPEEIPAVLK